jgi:PAS domain-containing protein
MAGGLSICLGLLALTTSRKRNRTVWFFVLLNAATASWSLGYFFVLNMPGVVDASLSPLGSAPQLLFVAMIVGVAAAPTYWFLFAASYAQLTEWTRGWRLGLVHLPLAYTFVVGLTNPLHHLLVRQASPGAEPSYGPLALPHQIGTFVLIGLGIWLIWSSSWRRGTRASRKQAVVLGAASVVPMLGGLAWSLRHALGLALTVNPTPVLFPVLNVALAYELLRTGLADIVPYATQQAFNAISDAAIALDRDGVIVAFNSAAKDLFPAVELGVGLGEVSPDLSATAGTCLASAASYAGFDLEQGERVFWGRARPTRDQRGIPMGCIVLLTDVTEVRLTQSKLLRLGLEAAGR